MEPLQKQVITLSHKVDALYQVVAQMSEKMSDAFTECKLAPVPTTNNSVENATGRSYPSHNSMNAAMEHKDVLVDVSHIDNQLQSGEKELAPEIQIQRLTAQLTAAYNRIAALEERLLSQRIH